MFKRRINPNLPISQVTQVAFEAGENTHNNEVEENEIVEELDVTVYGTPDKRLGLGETSGKSADAIEKPFKCQFCEFSTSKQGALGSHMRIHKEKGKSAEGTSEASTLYA